MGESNEENKIEFDLRKRSQSVAESRKKTDRKKNRVGAKPKSKIVNKPKINKDKISKSTKRTPHIRKPIKQTFKPKTQKKSPAKKKSSLGYLNDRIERLVNVSKKKAELRINGELTLSKMSPAMRMAYVYEEVYLLYQHQPKLSEDSKRRLITDRSRIAFQKAANLADSVGADYHTYVKAQFYWIHKWRGRACKIYEMHSESGKYSAVGRYKAYVEHMNSGERMEEDICRPYVKVASIKNSELYQANKDRMKRLKKVWGLDEEAILLAFFHEGVFDLDWLITNETYCRLKSEKKL